MDQLMYLLMSKIYYQLYHGNLKILGLFFFYFRLFNTCQENILYIALQITADLWYWKRPLCQVSNNIFQIFSKIDLWQANALIRFSSVLVIFVSPKRSVFLCLFFFKTVSKLPAFDVWMHSTTPIVWFFQLEYLFYASIESSVVGCCHCCCSRCLSGCLC